MERDESIFVTGIAADYKSGLFGSTTEVIERFGPARIFDAPSMENAMAGIAIGAAAVGKRPVIIHPRVDFMFLALDQIINLASKWRYMYGGNAGSVPLLIRAVVGRGWGQGATHSQSIQSLLAHFPGLQVIMPACPRDAKGMIMAALTGHQPVMCLEHRLLFNISEPVPEEPYETDIGSIRVVERGRDVTVVATSYMVVEAQAAVDAVKERGISVDLLDLRSIRPLDSKTILQSVQKTGRLVVIDTSWTTCGVTAEVAAVVAENAWSALKGPVIRLGNADCPAPVSASLERAFYPTSTAIANSILTLAGLDGSVEGVDVASDFRGPY